LNKNIKNNQINWKLVISGNKGGKCDESRISVVRNFQIYFKVMRKARKNGKTVD